MSRVSFGLLTALFVACDVPPPPSSDTPAEPEVEPAPIGAEQAFPGRTGRPGVVTFETKNGPQALHYLDYDGQRVIEGDILLPPAGRVGAQAAGVIAQWRWPNGVIPYEIDPSLPLTSQNRIHAAMKHWQDYTRIRLIRHSFETDFVAFVPGAGCSSNLGHIGGRQTINLAPDCTTGNIIHEIGHTVGLWHEQSRVDRDNHINIYWGNIDPNQHSQYQTYIQQWGGYDSADDIGPYDFNSIMHYDSCGFSIYAQCNPTVASGRTMLKKDGSGIVANRSGLSVLDQQAIAVMYGPRPPSPPTGLHGGPVSAGEIWLDWNDNPELNLAGYVVYRNGVAIARLGKAQGSSFADRGLPGDSDFTYQVSAYALDNSEGGRSGGHATFTPPGAVHAWPLWRYWNRNIVDHFYTIDRNDSGLQYYGFYLEGYEGRLFRYQHRGTVPVYRSWCASCGDHFYTTSWGETAGAAPRYAYEKVEGYIFPVQYAGSVPLYRYYNAVGDDHFYTVTRNDSGYAAYGYGFENIMGYVYP